MPLYSTIGLPTIGLTLVITASQAPPSQPALMHFAPTPANLNLSFLGLTGCTALALPVLAAPAATTSSGTAMLFLRIPGTGTLVGQSLYSQWVMLDGTTRGLALSQGAKLTIGKL